MELKCVFKYESWNVGLTKRDVYVCEIRGLQITRPRIIIQALVGNHVAGKSHQDVEAIGFFEGNIQYFPRGVDKLFPCLLGLQISNCGLSKISYVDLRGFSSVETIWFDSNKLKSLPTNLFDGKSKLTNINVSNN